MLKEQLYESAAPFHSVVERRLAGPVLTIWISSFVKEQSREGMITVHHSAVQHSPTVMTGQCVDICAV